MAEYKTILQFKKAYSDFKKVESFLLKEYDNYDDKKRQIVLKNFKERYCKPLNDVTALLSSDDIVRFEQGKL